MALFNFTQIVAVLIVVQCLIHLTGTVEVGYCSFPEFLWQAASGTINRKWYGRTEYFQNTDFWERHTEILVRKTQIEIREKVYSPCDRKDGEDEVPCFREDIVTNFICIAEEPNGKFRLRQKKNGQNSFSCIHFTKRSNNIIQIRKAPAEDMNEDWLCYDDYLLRDDWPWIAVEQREWVPCSLQGGFDFRASFSPSDEKKCPDEWRPSRIESECIRGDGLTFFFPSAQCSLFYSSHLVRNFQCWAAWNELQYSFIIFGDSRNKLPRYVLRLPRQGQMYDEFEANLYESAVAPLSRSASPLGHYHLSILRSEPGSCYDESVQCRELANEGRCTSSGIHEYANFCKKSCGLCKYGSSVKAECHFPSVLLNDWVHFSSKWNAREEMFVGSEHLSFSSLPTMICKSRHWEDTFYKVYSTFNNGCRPRFSCVDLNPGDGQTLNFRFSKTSFTDKSFDICVFENDPAPLNDMVRGSQPKLWLPMKSMQMGECGVRGQAALHMTTADGRKCSGSISDVDSRTCELLPHVSLQLQAPCSFSQDFVCAAFWELSKNASLLVTLTSTLHPEYICWERSFQRHLMRFKQVLCETRQADILSRGHPVLSSFTAARRETRCDHQLDEGLPEPHIALLVEHQATEAPLHRSAEDRRKQRKKQRTTTPHMTHQVTREHIAATAKPLQVAVVRSRGSRHPFDFSGFIFSVFVIGQWRLV